jgi:hypothetical protein
LPWWTAAKSRQLSLRSSTGSRAPSKTCAICWNSSRSAAFDLGSGIARHGLSRWPPGHHHHGSSLAVGAGSNRGTYPRRPTAHADQWGAGREYPLRIPSQPPTGSTSNLTPASRVCSPKSVTCARAAIRCEGLRSP